MKEFVTVINAVCSQHRNVWQVISMQKVYHGITLIESLDNYFDENDLPCMNDLIV